MAQRDSRKKRKRRQARRPAAAQPAEAQPVEAQPVEAPRPSRSEAKNEAVRAALVPLEQGERPLPVTIGAIVALSLVVVQIPLYLIWDGDERPSLPGFLFFNVLMLVMAWGMWKVKYWAVLGFQALLALCVLIVSLAVLVASDVVTVIICVAVIVPAATLFWFMVKALARIQMPEHR